MSKTITVATLLTAGKSYCVPELLAHLAALERPTGYTVRFLVVVAGELTPEKAELLAPWQAVPGPEITRYASDPYWRSLVAAELRERARQVLCRRKDAWVLWVDADVLPPADTLPRLLVHGRALASGLVLGRTAGNTICGIERRDPDTGFLTGSDHTVTPGAQEVGWVGMGLLLVRGDLARDLSFQPYLAGSAPVWTGEDGYFCAAASARCGEAVLLDADVTPWHVDETGIAVRAQWAGPVEDRLLVRVLRLLGEAAQGGCCLVPRVTGYSHRLGELVAGRPHWTNAAGETLPEAELRELAAGSQVLDLVEAG